MIDSSNTHRAVSLETILQNIRFICKEQQKLANILISSIHSDSRTVKKASLFVAVSGDTVDGHDFIDDALENGCVAVIVDEKKFDAEKNDYSGVICIRVPSTRAILGELSSAFYGYPQNQIKCVGVTGTNGKTTTTYLLEKILQDQGVSVGVIGTVSYRFKDKNGALQCFDAPFTTPDPILLMGMLFEMQQAGVRTVLMEVSSHALSQNRLDSVQFDVAVFTNLSHDHLDYHRNIETYFTEKTKLFTEHLKPDGKVVVCCKMYAENEVNWAEKLISLLQDKKIPFVRVGVAGKNTVITLDEYIGDAGGTSLTVTVTNDQEEKHAFYSPLVGRFNGDNIIAALGAVTVLEQDFEKALSSFKDCRGAPGRLERITVEEGHGNDDFAIFVDYAHTPDALLNVLETLKKLPHSKLICVFGCGGNRDNTKRADMGRIAGRLADKVIVTDDNPRNEDPAQIRKQILSGVQKTGMHLYHSTWSSDEDKSCGCLEIADRRKAIFYAVESASEDDIVVIAGKGHEPYQITKEGKHFFDDRLVVREALMGWNDTMVQKALLGSDSPQLPAKYTFNGIATDTRSMGAKELFVALRGETFDAHDYLDQAVSAGASGLVVEKEIAKNIMKDIPVFLVEDSLKSLGDLANYRRRVIAENTGLKVIGITGSCGKTTVKEMVACIFEKKWPNSSTTPENRVLKTRGNFNNLIGLPLSLLPVGIKHTAAILEMGMNQPGEIARLTEIAEPDICCILNVREAHIEGLGSVENVGKAKEELFQNTKESGVLVVNLDDPYIAACSEKYDQRKVYFTSDSDKINDADVWASDIEVAGNGTAIFMLHTKTVAKRVKLLIPGVHNVSNALAAAAISLAASIDFQYILDGLGEFVSHDMRMEVFRFTNGSGGILNDVYNANPASMSAAFSTLKSINAPIRIAVVGDMLELGKISKQAHEMLGYRAALQGIDCLLVVGDFAGYTAAGALTGGMSTEQVVRFSDKADIVPWLKEFFINKPIGCNVSDCWILVKASRGMALETVVEELIALAM